MRMDSKRIEELLGKYWQCETSLEEEQQLREYFSGDDIPEQLKETAALFRYFSQHKKKAITDVAFETHVLDQIKPRQSVMRKLVYNSMRIAAGLAVVMAAVWFVHSELQGDETSQDTFDDPKVAFEETKKALMMISKSFGKAEEQAKKINMFNEAQEEIAGEDEQEQSQL